MPESTLLIIWRLEIRADVGRSEKRCHGGPAKSQRTAQVFAQVSIAGGDPADGGRPAFRSAPAWSLLRPQLVFQSVQLATRPFGTAAAAHRGRHRTGQGGADAAAVSRR